MILQPQYYVVSPAYHAYSDCNDISIEFDNAVKPAYCVRKVGLRNFAMENECL